jgi:hypothetical protein
LPKTTTEKMETTNDKSKQNTNRYQPAKLDRERVIRKFAEDVAKWKYPRRV